MQNLVQTVVLGVGAGALDALLALGIVLIYRTTGVLNFAQAAIGTLAAYVAYSLAQGQPLWLSASLALLVAGALGAATSVAIGGTHGRDRALTATVATLAVAILLQQIVAIGWVSTAGSFPTPFGFSALVVGNVSVPYFIVAGILTSAGLALLLAAVLRWTRIGLGLRGIEEDPEAALLCGVSVGRLVIGVWAVAGMLAAVAGFFAAQLVFDPSYMDPFFLTALVAAVLGGLRSLPGAFVAAIGLEVARNLFEAYAPDRFTPYTQTFLILLLVAVLVLGPRRWLATSSRAG